MAATKQPSRLTSELLEMADDMHRLGIMDEAAHQQITVRQLGRTPLPTAEPITADEIRSVREDAHLSQAALARYLNLTTGYISALERGTKQATGSTLAILNVIRRKGIDAIM